MKYDSLFDSAAQKYNVDGNLLRAVAMTESSMNPNAVGPQTKYGQAQGIAQLIPSTAKSLGVTNPKDPAQAIPAMAQLLAQNLNRYGDVQKALMAYHGGTNPQNWGPLTQAYPQKVMSNMPTNSNQISPDQAFASFFGGAKQAPAQQQGKITPDDAFNAFFGQKSAIQAQPAQQAPQQVQQTPSFTSDPLGYLGDKAAALGAGAGYGLGSTVLAGQQLLGHGLQSIGANQIGNYLTQDAAQGLANLKSQVSPYEQQAPVASTIGNMIGSTVGTLPAMAAMPELAAPTLGKLALQGGALGAASGLLTPAQEGQDFAQQKLKQALGGATVGAIASPALGAIGKALSPNVSPDVQMLMNKGITPTPGQILGGGMARTEDKLMSVPLLGDMITSGKQNAVQDFNKAVYNEVLSPLGQTYSGPVGHQGVEAVKNQISNVYDDVLPKLSLQKDNQLTAQLDQLKQMSTGLAKPQQDDLLRTIKNDVEGSFSPAGYMDGQQLKETLSQLKSDIIGFNKGDPNQQKLARGLMQVQSLIEDAIDRQNPAELTNQYKAANTAYANFVRLQKAATGANASNRGGIITPADLMGAVRASDQSLRKGSVATGNALMQDFAGPAQNVMGLKYPDSGTAGRSMIGYLASGGAGAGMMTAPLATALTAGTLGAGGLMYTKPVMPLIAKLLAGQRSPVTQAIGNTIQNTSPLIAPALLSAIGGNQ